jgi:DNA-binding HxlR family transcriptional regulator
MVVQTRQLGHATLELLAEDWSVPILRELQDEPLRPSQLEQRLPDAPHSALMRRLSEMHALGIVNHERYTDLPPRAQYALTRAGRRVLDVVDAATRWERQWTSKRTRGMVALQLIRDERTRELILVLAHGPARASELHNHLPEPIARSTLRQRVAELANRGILIRTETDGVASYELTELARGLALVEIAAARWEWEWARPDQPVAARDVADVLRLFAPAAELPAELGGICQIRVGGPASTDVYLAADGRRIAALAARPHDLPQAACDATPHGWCDALLLRRWCGVTSTGNQALVAALLASVSSALFC